VREFCLWGYLRAFGWGAGLSLLVCSVVYYSCTQDAEQQRGALVVIDRNSDATGDAAAAAMRKAARRR
jgi:hypothetical protein